MPPPLQNCNPSTQDLIKKVKGLSLPEAKKELGYCDPYLYTPASRHIKKRIAGGRANAVHEIKQPNPVGMIPIPPVCAAGHCRFYSQIADIDTYSRLWMYVRSMDRHGRGWIDTTITKISEDIGLSKPTIKRYIRTGLNGHAVKHGDDVRWVQYFRDVVKKGDDVRISYISLSKVCVQLELDDYGAIAEIPHSQLTASKEIATQLTVQSRQRASRFKAKKETRRSVVSTDQLLSLSQSLKVKNTRLSPSDKSASRGQRTVVLYIGRKKTFVSRDFVLFGTSQQGTGEQLKRNRSTVNRRLSNSRRLRKGLDPLERRQIAVRSTRDEYIRAKLSADAQENSKPFMRSGGKYFTLHTNVYEEHHILIHARCARGWFKKSIGLIKSKLLADPGIKNPTPKLEKVTDSIFILGGAAIAKDHSRLLDKAGRSFQVKRFRSSSSGPSTRSFFQSKNLVEVRSSKNLNTDPIVEQSR